MSVQKVIAAVFSFLRHLNKAEQIVLMNLSPLEMLTTLETLADKLSGSKTQTISTNGHILDNNGNKISSLNHNHHHKEIYSKISPVLHKNIEK